MYAVLAVRDVHCYYGRGRWSDGVAVTNLLFL